LLEDPRLWDSGDIPSPPDREWIPLVKLRRRSGSCPQNGERPSSHFHFCLKAPGSIVVSVCIVLVFIVVCVTYMTLEMGQAQVTPLSLFSDHFSDVRARAREQGLEIKKGRLSILCRNEWPTFGI
jgi:hypothetical protein